MKKSLRKFLSFATAVCVICSVLSVGTPFKLTVSAASESDVTFELNDDGKSYGVSYCENSASGSLTIPSTYNGKPVTSISYLAFYGCANLDSITIPNSVTSIGEDAFNNTAYYNNSGNWENDVLYIGNHLIKAKDTVSGDYVVKDSTKTIADKAFSGCSGLSYVTIGNRVTSIGDGAFLSCPNVTVRCYIGSYAQVFAEKTESNILCLGLFPSVKLS